ncbi:hypothetical protein FIBSPDRAFT_928130 [Athelia psychrophila]|uniref:Uncharacterized protein n=1 Tax=Athelia psychrophila TaxID=1759441 RepID=A0A166QWP7_9AGAM|nr:hypothetical protein FIBSPDRAFT_928130 [Fibularhizoctonia sp. CBS 109695]
MAQTNTSNTRDSEINNVGRDQVSLLSARDIIVHQINLNYHFYSTSSPAAVTASQSVNGSSSAGTRGRRLEETQARTEDEGIVVAGTGSLMRKLWLIVCILLACSIRCVNYG